MMAEISSANTIANPAPEPTFSTSSTGSSARTPNATAPVDVSTPIRFQQPDQITAIGRLQSVGVDDGGDRIGRVVKSVHEFEAQRHPQREQKKDSAADRDGLSK